MNLKSAKRAALAAVGLLTIDGAELSSEYNLQNDRLIRLAYWADSAQKEIAFTNAPIYRRSEYAVDSVKNLIDESEERIEDIKTHRNDAVAKTVRGAHSFYVEVDGCASIFVLVDGALYKEYDVEGRGASFTPVFDIIECSDEAEVTLIMGGENFYHFRREALYKEKFESAEKIPKNCGFIPFSDIAKDVYRVLPNDIKFKGSMNSEGEYHFLGNELYLGIKSEGVWSVGYHAIPCDIDENTPDDYEFEVPAFAHPSIVMKMAYGICVDMGFTSSSYAVFKNEHAQLFNAAMSGSRCTFTEIKNVY